jgi:hypothetical protein
MNEEARTNTKSNVNSDIKILAKEVLSKEDFETAKNVFNGIISDNYSRNLEAINYLTTLVPRRPKRPLYYVNYELSYGRRMQTRIVVNYLGGFMEMNMAQLSKKVGRFKNFLPFGSVLFRLKGKIPTDLYSGLYKYNKIFYCRAKHYYENYGRNEHLFSLMDAVLCCFVTMNLHKKIVDRFNIKYVEPNGKYYL